ncbi:MAG: hypothetical protein ACRDM1_00165 [Gaiellaceae bacterium]
MDWTSLADEQRARYEQQHGEPDERALVRRGNAAYAAGLALLMAGDGDAPDWFTRAAARWRESWDAAPPHDAWGRPIGALKAALLARDDAAVEELAGWTLELGTATASSPIGRYAAALALLALGRWAEARHVAESLRELGDFPHELAEALAFVAAHDPIAYLEAVESVVGSFEARTEYLENVPVADTALVLAELARRRGIAQELPESALLPSVNRPSRPARTPDETRP